MTRRREEQHIQRAVFQHVKHRIARDAFCFAVANGGIRNKAEAAIFNGLGLTAGIPDVVAIRGGQIFGLELKTEVGRPSKEQEAVLKAMERAGAIVAIAYGLDAAIDKLEQWGILRGRAMIRAEMRKSDAEDHPS